MVFSDLFFIYAFIPAFILCYIAGSFIDKHWLSDGGKESFAAKNMALVIFSFIFYAWGEPMYVFLMLICVLINYICGRCIDSASSHRKLALVIGLVLNISILATFKYLGFFAEQLQNLGLPVTVPKIALPIGISFYTFQSISYLIDVYKKESPVQRRFADLLLYISMFPQLIAGPIVRYGTVASEINKRSVNSKDIADGSFRFLIGLGKKVVLANQLSEVSDQLLVNGFNDLTTTGAWVGIAAFTLQIYFDFSGYSDMAIGIGRCLGFHFNENFDHPYCCNSISDFWRRWHMSLGSFFRDYVYIPLGGNRSHQALNIFVVWFLTGMWHGASWNFIIWGLYFGFIVMLEKYTLLRVHNRIPAPLLHIYSILLVVIGWGIFYFVDINQMLAFFKILFGGSAVLHDFVTESALASNFWLWIIAIAFCLPLRKWAMMATTHICGKDTKAETFVVYSARIIYSIAVLILSTALLVGATNNAFLYTRF
ncbi:MAG: MBOAT family protein [Prevotellaceae bacterium]|nr:MBOAT family protein [Candidatus Minthosoma caballi]